MTYDPEEHRIASSQAGRWAGLFGRDSYGNRVDINGERETLLGTDIKNPYHQENMVYGMFAPDNSNSNNGSIFDNASNACGNQNYSERSHSNYSGPTGSLFSRIANFITSPTVVSPVLAGILYKMYVTSPTPSLGAAAAVLGVPGLYGSLWLIRDSQKKYPHSSETPVTNRIEDYVSMGAVGFFWGGVFGLGGSFVSMMMFRSEVSNSQIPQNYAVGSLQDKQQVPQRQMTSHHTALLSALRRANKGAIRSVYLRF